MAWNFWVLIIGGVWYRHLKFQPSWRYFYNIAFLGVCYVLSPLSSYIRVQLATSTSYVSNIHFHLIKWIWTKFDMKLSFHPGIVRTGSNLSSEVIWGHLFRSKWGHLIQVKKVLWQFSGRRRHGIKNVYKSQVAQNPWTWYSMRVDLTVVIIWGHNLRSNNFQKHKIYGFSLHDIMRELAYPNF